MAKLQQAAAGGPLLIGVVHLGPLPGSPRALRARRDEGSSTGLAALIDAARADAETLLSAGFDGYIVENFFDSPFFPGPVPPHVLTVMTRVALALPRSGALVGVNVLRNDARGALAVAAAAELDFIRVNVHTSAMVTDQGVIAGDAARTMREREQIAPDVALLADVDVKHATPLGAKYDIADAARETAYRGLADGLIVTGRATGSPADLDDLERVTRAVPDRPVFVGSGVTDETIAATLRQASGVIVGTWVKEGSEVDAPVSAERARALAARAGR